MHPNEDVDISDLVAAMAMAALAGATDVYGLSRLGDLFVSFMSGNTTIMAVSLGKADGARAASIAGILALFVLGAAGGAALAEKAGRRHGPSVMGLVALVLAIPLAFDAATVPCLVLAMGALNAAMARLGTTAISLTYVTGALVKLGAGLGRWVVGVKEPRDFLLHVPIWLSLFAGAVGAALLQPRWRDFIWVLPVAAALLVPLLAWHGERESKGVV